MAEPDNIIGGVSETFIGGGGGASEEALETSLDVEPSPEQAEATIDYKTQYDTLLAQQEAERARLAPLLMQLQKAQQDSEAKRLEEEKTQALQIADAIEKASEESDEPLTSDQRVRLRGLLESGVLYEQEREAVAQERLAASAIWYAASHMMSDPVKGPVIRELLSLGSELGKYGDPRLMEARVKMMGDVGRSALAAAADQAAKQRLASGVDNVAGAPVTMGSLQDGEVIGRKIADRGVRSLTSMEKKSYNSWRRAKGLPTVTGWG